MSHDERLMRINGYWEIRQGMRDSYGHPEKQCITQGDNDLHAAPFRFNGRDVVMFKLPPQSECVK